MTHTDLLDWLQEQQLFPKFYWRNERDEFAAAGATRTFNEIPSFERENKDLLVLGGRAFSLEQTEDSTWANFPRQFYFTPKLFLSKRSDSLQNSNSAFSKPQHLLHALSENQWKKNIEGCLRRIQDKEFNKLVLARRSTLAFQESPSPLALLKELRAASFKTTLFAFQLDPSYAFIGSTPELLYRRQAQTIYTHALAGTRRRGKTEQEDLTLKNELLTCSKEEREWAFVKEHLIEALSKICENLEYQKEKSLLQNAALQHLVCNFSGELQNWIQDQAIIETLHPTPAVGSVPSSSTQDLLKNYEAFDRGWYAAPIGWAKREAAEFAVGIRSGLIQGNQLHLFAGTGIVSGSCSANEWQELDHKIAPFTRIFS